jgi:hypothetical protein
MPDGRAQAVARRCGVETLAIAMREKEWSVGAALDRRQSQCASLDRVGGTAARRSLCPDGSSRRRTDLRRFPRSSHAVAPGRRLRNARSCKGALAPRQPPAATPLLRFVHLSSERAREVVRPDCSFANKQESPPALLVVVPGGGLREDRIRRPLRPGAGVCGSVVDTLTSVVRGTLRPIPVADLTIVGLRGQLAVSPG